MRRKDADQSHHELMAKIAEGEELSPREALSVIRMIQKLMKSHTEVRDEVRRRLVEPARPPKTLTFRDADRLLRRETGLDLKSALEQQLVCHVRWEILKPEDLQKDSYYRRILQHVFRINKAVVHEVIEACQRGEELTPIFVPGSFSPQDASEELIEAGPIPMHDRHPHGNSRGETGATLFKDVRGLDPRSFAPAFRHFRAHVRDRMDVLYGKAFESENARAVPRAEPHLVFVHDGEPPKAHALQYYEMAEQGTKFTGMAEYLLWLRYELDRQMEVRMRNFSQLTPEKYRKELYSSIFIGSVRSPDSQYEMFMPLQVLPGGYVPSLFWESNKIALINGRAGDGWVEGKPRRARKMIG